ncbi:MAG: PAS domain-containing sensor histidine kinase [Xanthomonadales bacterium]|nr:PAS domain-containing sensor histidine kinase [Xanthomonadales bacterium]
MAQDPGVSCGSGLPDELLDALPVLELLATGVGYLDAGARLAWANPALSDLLPAIDRPGRAAAPACWQGLGAALRRVRPDGQPVRLLVPPARPGEAPLRVVLCPLGQAPGALLEVQQDDAVTGVPISASLQALAHELKNPLGGLRGAAQLLARRVLDPDLRAYADIIVAEVDRLSELTARLLAPARPAAPIQVNVHGLLERVRLLVGAEVAAIERDYDPSLPDCPGEPDRLVQVLLNLLHNALAAGARRIVLRTRAEHAARLAGGRGRAVRVDVMDDGAGVPEAVRATLFLPLVSGREGGTGLGLALAHEIVSEHGGRIAYDSRPGATVFSVWLPLPASEADGGGG